jgi:hypothetical protein
VFSFAAAGSAALALVALSSSASFLWRDAKTTTAGSATAADNSLGIYRRLGVQPPHTTGRVLRVGLGIEFPIARWAWKVHGRLLPLLHVFEERPPGDVFVNLRVLWCKLLISLDPGSPAYEGEPSGKKRQDKHDDQQLYATYRMLPPYSIKWALRYLGMWRIFPRWMHANIELRVVYLQTALEKVLGSQHQKNPPKDEGATLPENAAPSQNTKDGLVASDKRGYVNDSSESICVIVLGGGYDPRGATLSIRFGPLSNRRSPHARRFVQRVYELDLPKVVESKRRLLVRAAFDVENGTGTDTGDDYNQCGSDTMYRNHGVRLEGVDLNDDAAVDRTLNKIRHDLIAMATELSNAASSTTGENQWHVVVISEAVLMYLEPGKTERIFEGVAERFRGGCSGDHRACFGGASFVFADRLLRTTQNSTTTRPVTISKTPDSIEREESEIRKWLRERGWELEELLLKPGSTRHLGIASTISM